MQRYLNLGGDSGVSAYECGPDSISVRFSDGKTYVYNYASCGASHCEMMKQLAAAGSGLNSYINRYVKKGYATSF